MNEHEWQEVIGAIGMFVLITTVVVSLIWRGAFIKRAGIQHLKEEQYRKLAKRVAESQEQTAEQLKALNDRIEKLERSNASIEETLKVVE